LQDPQFADDIIDSYYSGDAIILKHVFAPELLTDLRKRVYEFGKTIPPAASVKILDGCLDHHQAIDTTGLHPTGYTAIDHSYFFFRWNKDPLGIYKDVSDVWKVFKLMGGFDSDEYKENIPSDGVVDRIQVIHYPPGSGKISVHSDPYKNQRMIIGILLSRPGVDYQEGGFHLLSPDKNVYRLEPEVEMGCIYSVYPSMFHGVEVVDPNKKVDWESDKGRWYMTLYSPDSHMVANRDTAMKAD
jgi:hypothetical protein